MKIKPAAGFGLMAAAILPLLSANSQETPAPVPPATTAAPAGFSPAVAEAIKLAQSGVGDDVVMAYIRNSQTPYNLSAADIVALKNTGVSRPILAAMLNHDQSLRNPPPAVHPQNLYPPAIPAISMPQPVPASQSGSIANAAIVPTAPTIPEPGAAAPAPQTGPPQPAPLRPTVVEQPPPPPRVGIVPVAPAPGYYWAPGYWSWNGGWVWVDGRWVVRPWHGAVWSGGYWGRHGRGYIWVGGRWH
jgi:hypothetical protein